MNYRSVFLKVTILIHKCMAFSDVLNLEEAAFRQKRKTNVHVIRLQYCDTETPFMLLLVH